MYIETLPYCHLVHMITSLLRPLFLSWHNAHAFSYLKNHSINMVNGHILKSQHGQSLTCVILYNLPVYVATQTTNNNVHLSIT